LVLDGTAGLVANRRNDNPAIVIDREVKEVVEVETLLGTIRPPHKINMFP